MGHKRCILCKMTDSTMSGPLKPPATSGFSTMGDASYANDAAYKASIVDAAAAAVAEVTGSAHYAGQMNSNAYDVKSPLHPNKVFVGGVPPAATEREVHQLFEQEIGGVLHVQLGLHAGDPTRYHKGYGFVVFATKELQDKALARCKFPIMEREIEVKPMDLAAKPRQRTIGTEGSASEEVPENQKLFIALKSGTTPHECVGLDENELREHFNHYGNVIKVVIVKDKVSQEAKGYGFIYFDSPKGPQIALQAGREHNITATCRVECKHFQIPTTTRGMSMTQGYGMGMPMSGMMMMNPYASMYGGMYGSPGAMAYGYGYGGGGMGYAAQTASGPYAGMQGRSPTGQQYGSPTGAPTATSAAPGGAAAAAGATAMAGARNPVSYRPSDNAAGYGGGMTPQVSQGSMMSAAMQGYSAAGYQNSMQRPMMASGMTGGDKPADKTGMQPQGYPAGYMTGYPVMNANATNQSQTAVDGQQYGVGGYYGYPAMGPSR